MADCFLMKKGQTQNIEYGENIFDFDNFKTTLSALSQPVVNGTVKWLDNGFTLNATGNDCYTFWQYGSAPTVAVKSNTAYELSYDVNGAGGNNYIFFEYPPSTNIMINYNNHKTKLILRTMDSTKKLTLRFGVHSAGTSCTFTNIKLRQIL